MVQTLETQHSEAMILLTKHIQAVLKLDITLHDAFAILNQKKALPRHDQESDLERVNRNTVLVLVLVIIYPAQ